MDVLSGTSARPLPVLGARLAKAVHEKEGMAHFLPARVEQSNGEPEVSVLPWQGLRGRGDAGAGQCILGGAGGAAGLGGWGMGDGDAAARA